jgi:hypothetical protein
MIINFGRKFSFGMIHTLLIEGAIDLKFLQPVKLLSHIFLVACGGKQRVCLLQ